MLNSVLLLRLCSATLFIFSSNSIFAATSSDAQLCDQAAEHAASQSDAPLEVLRAISRVESGREIRGATAPWPWAINHAGKGYWFDTEQQALDFARSLLANGDDNFDLGCYQINQHWHGDKFSSLEEAISPNTNALIAAEFLQRLFEHRQDWGGAVAAYHSSTPTEGQQYLVKVEAMLQRLRGTLPDTFPQPDQFAQAMPENNFPLLQAGASHANASLVPLGRGGKPLYSVTP